MSNLKELPKRFFTFLCLCSKDPAELAIQVPYDSLSEIRTGFSNLSSAQVKNRVSAFSLRLFESENNRQEVVESKATVLAGFAGTTTAALLALFAFLLDADQLRLLGSTDSGKIALFTLVVLATLVIVFLVVSIFMSIRAISPRGYQSPHPKIVMPKGRLTEDELRAEEAAQYLISYLRNVVTNSQKLNALSCAIVYFKAAMATLILIAAILGLYAIAVGSGSIPIQSGATLTSTPTASPCPSRTPTAVPTATWTASPTREVDISPSSTGNP